MPQRPRHLPDPVEIVTSGKVAHKSVLLLVDSAAATRTRLLLPPVADDPGDPYYKDPNSENTKPGVFNF